MSTDYYHYSGKHIDYESEQQRSTDSLLHSGGWLFKQVSTYTESSPLIISGGVKQKLIIPTNDDGFTESRYLTLNYDFVNNKFLPLTEGDVYIVNVRMKVVPVNQAGHLNISMEVPNFIYNPINADTLSFSKGAGEEHFFSPDMMIFSGQDTVNNGVEFYINPVGTDISVYDYSVLICRLYCDRGN